MDIVTVLGSAFQLLGWMAPIILLLVLSFRINVHFTSGFGIVHLYVGGSIVAMDLLFNTIWFSHFGQYTGDVRLVSHTVLLAGILIVLWGAGRLLTKALAEQRIVLETFERKLAKSVLIVFGIVVLLPTVATVVHGSDAASIVDHVLYGINSVLLSTTYLGLALYGSQTGAFRGKWAFGLLLTASGFLLADAVFRTLVIELHAPPPELIVLRSLSSLVFAFAAFVMGWAGRKVLRRLVPSLKQTAPVSRVHYHKRSVQQKFVFVLAVSLLVLAVTAIIIMDSVRSSIQNIQEVYIRDQQRVAEAMKENYSDLTRTLVGVLDRLSGEEAVRTVDRKNLPPMFRETFIKWGNIVLAISRVDSNGILRYTFPENRSVLNTDLSGQPHVKTFLSKRQRLMSDIFRSVQGYDCIALYEPVYAPGTSVQGSPLGRTKGVDSVFAGGVAMLIRIGAFSERAFRNIAILSPNPVAAINEHGQVTAASDSAFIGRSGLAYLKSVFPNRIRDDSLEDLLRRALAVTSPSFVQLRDQENVGAQRGVVAFPVDLVDHRWGCIVLPVREAQIVDLSVGSVGRQVTLIGIFSGVLAILMGTLLFIFYRWSQFLEREVDRELEVIHQSEKRYFELFSSSPAGIYVSTVHGEVLEANEALAKIYGYDSPDELKTRPAGELYKDWNDRTKFLEEIQRKGAVQHSIAEGKRRDGSQVFVVDNARLERDPLTHEERIRGAIVDITQIVLLQRQVEAHQRTTEIVNEALVIALEETTLTDFIDKVLSIVGKRFSLHRVSILVKDQTDLTQPSYNWVAPGIAPAPPSKVNFADLTNALASEFGPMETLCRLSSDAPQGPVRQLLRERGVTNAILTKIQSKQELWGYLVMDGAGVHEEWHRLEIDLMRSVGQIISTVVDRFREAESRRKLEEEQRKLFQVFDQLSESVFITNAEGTIEYVNSGFTAITGYSRDEAVGKTPRILRSGEHPPEFYKKVWDTILAGRDFRGRMKNKRKDGSLYTEEMVISPVFDGEGQLSHFVSVSYDVTAQVTFEEQLAQSQKLESIGLLAGGIAHDFNNLLGGILGYASLMKAKISAENPFFRYVDTIERSALRAADLTSQLLAFARGGRYDIKPINLNSVVRETLRILERSIDKSISIETHLDNHLPAVEGDAGQFQQVLMNLCINARDAMPNGGTLSIESGAIVLDEKFVSSRVDARQGPYVKLSVVDTGIGMDKETMKRIFEPFFTTKEKGKGTGLGLSMVYGIIKNNGGFVDVESQPGAGSAFSIYLPSTLRKEQERKRQQDMVKGGTETILIVDDEEHVREMAQEILKDAGYNVLTARNGEEAIEVYGKGAKEIDLIIIDMIMPKLGGKGTYLKLREIDPGVRALLSSGYSKDGQAQEILESGARGFLQKPYNMEELLKKVRTTLDES